MPTEVDRFRDAVAPVFWSEQVARIAQSHGYAISQAEAWEFCDGLAASDSRAPSDFELEMVAAGINGPLKPGDAAPKG